MLVVDDHLVAVIDPARSQGSFQHVGVGQRVSTTAPRRPGQGEVEVEVGRPGEVCAAYSSRPEVPTRAYWTSSTLTSPRIGRCELGGRDEGGHPPIQPRGAAGDNRRHVRPGPSRAGPRVKPVVPSGGGMPLCWVPTSTSSCPTCPPTAHAVTRSSPGKEPSPYSTRRSRAGSPVSPWCSSATVWAATSRWRGRPVTRNGSRASGSSAPPRCPRARGRPCTGSSPWWSSGSGSTGSPDPGPAVGRPVARGVRRGAQGGRVRVRRHPRCPGRGDEQRPAGDAR